MRSCCVLVFLHFPPVFLFYWPVFLVFFSLVIYIYIYIYIYILLVSFWCCPPQLALGGTAAMLQPLVLLKFSFVLLRLFFTFVFCPCLRDIISFSLTRKWLFHAAFEYFICVPPFPDETKPCFANGWRVCLVCFVSRSASSPGAGRGRVDESKRGQTGKQGTRPTINSR